LKRNSPSSAPVIESMVIPVMPVHDRQAEAGPVTTGITDVLTIGQEATVFRPVQSALTATGWAVTHADTVEGAVAYLHSNAAAVAVAEAELGGNDWCTLVAHLRNAADAPEVILVTGNKMPLLDAIRAGAFDLLQRPFHQSDLLWAVATAWHKSMTRRERPFGGGPCSDEVGMSMGLRNAQSRWLRGPGLDVGSGVRALGCPDRKPYRGRTLNELTKQQRRAARSGRAFRTTGLTRRSHKMATGLQFYNSGSEGCCNDI
jgi:ActR/RegA family two-component response regulator